MGNVWGSDYYSYMLRCSCSKAYNNSKEVEASMISIIIYNYSFRIASYPDWMYSLSISGWCDSDKLGVGDGNSNSNSNILCDRCV